MNINQIKYFVSVVEKGSFSLAAQQCYVTVQAVSKSIGDLERELKLKLFSRANRGVTPTREGKLFYDKARRVTELFDELEKFSVHTPEIAPRSEIFRMALCAPAFTGNTRIRTTLAKFLGENLHISVSIPLTTGNEATDQLARDEIDAFVTIGSYQNPAIDCVEIGSLPTAVVMAHTNPLAKKDTVTLQDLPAYPIGVSDIWDTFNESILHSYLRQGLTSETRFIHTQSDFLSFLKDENGLFFVAYIPALQEVFPGCTSRLVVGEGSLEVPLCLVTPKDKKPYGYQLIKAFLSQATKVLNA